MSRAGAQGRRRTRIRTQTTLRARPPRCGTPQSQARDEDEPKQKKCLRVGPPIHSRHHYYSYDESSNLERLRVGCLAVRLAPQTSTATLMNLLPGKKNEAPAKSRTRLARPMTGRFHLVLSFTLRAQVNPTWPQDKTQRSSSTPLVAAVVKLGAPPGCHLSRHTCTGELDLHSKQLKHQAASAGLLHLADARTRKQGEQQQAESHMHMIQNLTEIIAV